MHQVTGMLTAAKPKLFYCIVSLLAFFNFFAVFEVSLFSPLTDVTNYVFKHLYLLFFTLGSIDPEG